MFDKRLIIVYVIAFLLGFSAGYPLTANMVWEIQQKEG